ncbi:MAG: Lrp/AsnC family transcriptional regulator [Bacteroidales bacterium]|nr:Lrp/AsnC family transcriptional regulator [Bacteroidales bacterium]
MSVRPKIDEIDVRILRILLNDPRTSFAEIAKYCGMSANTIRMRHKRLKETGVITGAIMQVTPKSLGYNCIALLSIQANANEETSVYEFVKNIPNIINTFQPIGKYNIHGLAALKSVDELARTVDQIKSNPYVIDVKEHIWVDVVRMDHPENLVIEPFEGLLNTTALLPKGENPKPTIIPAHVAKVAEEKRLEESYEFDKIDWSIMTILSKNANMSFRKIAKKVAVSTQTVIRKYEQIRKSVLPYSSITIDLTKLGYIGIAVFHIKTSYRHTISTVFDEILRIPNVISACKCLGTIDVFIAAPFSDFEQLYNLKQGISKTPGVEQMEVYIDKPFSRWPMSPLIQILSNQV